jgi:small subunit ribosomal protein S6e
MDDFRVPNVLRVVDLGWRGMKLNIAYSRNGTAKQFDCSDDHIRRGNLFEHRLGQDVDGALFSPEFAGYLFRLKGGSDKDGFPMVQGVLANARVALLLKRGAINFNEFRGRSGERRRKSVRGCIVAGDIACLNAVIVKVGDKPIEGVTDVTAPRRLGPKRASKIRKLFNLGNDDDVRRYVVRRKVEKKDKKTRFKAPAIQRLVSSKSRAARVKKIKARRASLVVSSTSRREFLHAIGKARQAARQRKNALAQVATVKSATRK